jgi:ribonuclease R
MKELFDILNRRRHRRGSIDFDLKEPEIVLDDEGMVEEIIAAERNIAHRLIEEFMLLANETVAAHLDAHDVPTLYRIHEEPDPLKVEEFEEFISTLGYSLGKASSKVTPGLPEARRTDARHAEEKPIAFLMLRTMQKARYDPANLATSAWRRSATRTSRHPSAAIRTWSCTARCARGATAA